MRLLVATLVAQLFFIACDNSEPSLDQIISDAESNAAQRQINDIVVKCDDVENSQEVALTYNALKIAMGAETCLDMAQKSPRFESFSCR